MFIQGWIRMLDAIAKRPRSQDVRQQILDTALRLFSQDGYFNTSIHDVQREAGVSIGSIYNHFGGKEGIAKALYHSLLEKMEALVDEVVSARTGAYDRGLAVVERLFLVTEQEPEAMRFIFGAKHREFLPDEPPICSAKPFVKLRDIIAVGVQNGEIRQIDHWVAASCAFGPALRMIALRLDGTMPKSLTGYGETVWNAAWLSVKEPDQSSCTGV
jgi:AcrR family transcriptional regulator